MLAIAILAAGKGSRMKSSIPKVLQKIGGITLIERVLYSCKEINPDRRLLIIGHQAEQVRKFLKQNKNLEFVIQQPQNGTGHAIQQLIPALDTFEGELVVLNGDVPLLKPSTLKALISSHKLHNSEVTLLSAKLANPTGYGRVITDEKGEVKTIIEDQDCNSEQRKNTLTNAGVYCFNWKSLKSILTSISSNNSQNEIYLTDAVTLLSKSRHLEVNDSREVSGINNKLQMAQCEEFLQERLRNYWMKEGVTFIDPLSCTISEHCSFGKDVVIEPQTHLRERCAIGNNCHLGPDVYIQNSTIGNNVKIFYSVINDSKVANGVQIGPYAHLRPESELSENCKIGNFVEIKKSILGKETQANHLSYIGNSTIGAKVNIGAGTITANYDGVKKHRTIIGDNTKTGANSVLIAPITLGSNVTVGAGSSVSKDIPNNALAIERSKQIIKNDWFKK